MSFPISPTNGQQTTVNGIQYVYSTTDNSWTRLTQSVGNVSVDLTNISSDVIPSANVTYDIGSSTNRWRDLWLSGNTIHLGEANISAVGNTIALPTNSLSFYTGNIGGASLVSGQTISVPAYVLTYGDPIETPGGDGQWGSSLAFDSTGNLYIIGGIGTNIGEQVGIIKLDRTGTILQQKYLSNVVPNGNDPVGDAITVDNSGNVIIGVGGYGYNASVLKLNADLNTIFWSKGFYHQHTSGHSDQRVRDISVDSQNNIYVSAGDYTFYTNPPKLIKLDTHGTLIWQRKLNTIARGFQTAIDSQDNIYWVGQAAIDDNFTDFNGFILKLDSTGSILWQYAIELNGTYNNIQGVGVDSQDNVVICGVTSVPPNNFRLCLLKFDQNGNLLWQRFLEDSPQSVEGYSIAFDTDNNIYVSGITYDNADILIVRYDTDGNLTWQRRLGTTEDDWQWYDSSWRAIDIFGNCFAITGYNNFGATTPYELIAAQLPIDGTLIGNVDQWSYTATTFANVEASLTPNNAGYTTETYSLTENTWTFEFSDVTTLTTNVVSYGNIVESSVTTTSLAADNIFVKTINLETEILWANGNTYGSSITLESISSNVIPSANITYDLGSSTNRWRDLWLSGNTIHLGEANISAIGNTISLPADSLSSYSGNLSAGNILLSTVTTTTIITDNLEFDPTMMYLSGPSFVLSNNNTTVTALSTMPGEPSLLGTLAIQDNEKKVFTTYINSGPARVDYLGIGVARANVNISDYPGKDFNSVAVYDDGVVYGSPIFYPNSLPFFGAGDTVDIAVDRVNDLLWVRVNGGNWNDDPANNPVTATGYGVSLAAFNDADPLYPIYGPYYYSGSGDEISIVQTSPYSLPSGFTQLGGGNLVTTSYGNVSIGNGIVRADNLEVSENLWATDATSPTIKYNWIGTYGDLGIDTQGEYGSSVAYDSTGNIFVIGGSSNFLAAEAGLFKFNLEGTLLWQKRFSANLGVNIVADNDNNIIFTVGDDGATCCVIKCNNDGDIIWQKRFLANGPFEGEPYGVYTDNSNNVYVIVTQDNSFVSLIKLDYNGDELWQRTLVNDLGQNLYYFNLTVNRTTGDVYVTGQKYGSVSENGSTDASCILKFDSSGNLQWQRQLVTATGYDSLYNAVIDSQGSVYMAGTQDYPNYLTVVKYDNQGNLTWQRTLDSQLSGSEFFGISIDSDDNVYAIGNLYLTSDIIIAKYSSAGNLVWQRIIGTALNDYIWYSVGNQAIDVFQNQFVITGFTYYPNNVYNMIVAQLPIDGSLTANINQWYYQETFFNNSAGISSNTAGTLIDSVGNLTIVTGNLTSNSSSFTSNITYYGNTVSAGSSITPVKNIYAGNVYAGNVVPLANLTYDLGSSTNRWRDLYLSGNSLYIGGAVISAAGNAVNLPAGSTIQGALITGNVTFDGNTIKAPIDASLTIQTEYSYQPYWATTLSGVDNEWANGVTTDSTNNIYVTGSIITGGAGSNDLLLAKLDTNGNIVWQKILGSFSNDIGDSVTTDSTDNIYVCGSAYNTGAARADFILAKFDTSGNVVWQRFLGIDNFVVFNHSSVTTDNTDNIYICGHIYPISSGTSYDLVLAKFDTDGNIVWQRLLSGLGGDLGFSVTTDSLNNVYACGQTYSQGGGNGELLLAKFDTSGNLLWQRVLGSDANTLQIGRSVTSDSNNNIYVFGHTYTDSSGNDLLLAKFDTSGNLLWQKVLVGVEGDEGYSIATDSNDNIYVCGKSGTINANDNAIIVKYNSSGTVVWQRGFGRTNTVYDSAWGIAIDSDDDIIITGASDGPTTGDDVLVVKLPNDGSGTGTHGIFEYYATTLTEATATLTVATGTLTANTANLTLNTGTLTANTGGLVSSNFVNLPGIKVAGSSSWIFGADGSLTFPDNTVQTTASSAANQETLTTFTNATGNVTHDYTLGSTFYHSNVSSNFTANFINVPITNNQKISVELIIDQGATPNIANLIQINGNIPTIRWTTITAPTGLASNVDIISFNLLRVSNDWIVTGSLTSYGYIL